MEKDLCKDEGSNRVGTVKKNDTRGIPRTELRDGELLSHLYHPHSYSTWTEDVGGSTLDVLSTYFSYVYSIISYRIIFWGNSSHSEEIFKIQKRIITTIMNSFNNASCRQLFKELSILPIQSQYTFSILLFVTKNKDQFLFNSQVHKSTKGKLPIYTYLQQTWQYTKRVFIIQELRSTIIYQQPLKIYLVIRINSN